MLLDGGIVEIVPVQTLKSLWAEYIIAVDLNAGSSFEKPENILDVIVNRFQFVMNQTSKLQTSNTDLHIQPDLSGFSKSDTDQV